MRRGLWCVLLGIMLLSSFAVSAKERFTATVNVESAFTRVRPAFDAEATASLFEDEQLEAISRNLDGTWFEVRRPGRMNTLGWVFGEVLEWDFRPELLPLGDLTTGVVGPSPLMSAPDRAIFINESPTLRSQPLRTSRRIAEVRIPFGVTLPIVARNQDGSWLYVNYLGHQGWIIAFAGREVPNVLDIPQAVNLPPLENVPREIIPVALQQAQVDRLRAFINDRRGYAANLELFWWRVFRGETMPCDAPAELTNYPYTENDVRELPELQRYAPRLVTAVEYMQSSKALLQQCGIVSPSAVVEARNGAINARVIFDATLEALQALEEDVIYRGR